MRSFFYLYTVNNKFPRKEKLKSPKTISRLFSEGKTHSNFPVKVFFIPLSHEENNIAAFAVPKRNFKLAVDRNRIKRQLREAYRLNKNIILENKETKFAMLFLFLAKEKPQYSQVSTSMVKLLTKLKDEKPS